MLDFAAPVSRSAQNSPVESNHRAAIANGLPSRSKSDVASHPASFGPRADYQISNYQNYPGAPNVPKRNTQSKPPGAVADALKGNIGGGRERGRHSSITETNISAKSRSPYHRFGMRSSSPAVYETPDGRQLNMNEGFKYLSDQSLSAAGGSLAALAEKNRRRKYNSKGEPITQRLEKDYGPGGEDALDDSSEYDYDTDASNTSRQSRGRRGKPYEAQESTLGMGQAKGPRVAQSLMVGSSPELELPASGHKATKMSRILSGGFDIFGVICGDAASVIHSSNVPANFIDT